MVIRRAVSHGLAACFMDLVFNEKSKKTPWEILINKRIVNQLNCVQRIGI